MGVAFGDQFSCDLSEDVVPSAELDLQLTGRDGKRGEGGRELVRELPVQFSERFEVELLQEDSLLVVVGEIGRERAGAVEAARNGRMS